MSLLNIRGGLIGRRHLLFNFIMIQGRTEAAIKHQIALDSLENEAGGAYGWLVVNTYSYGSWNDVVSLSFYRITHLSA